MLGKLMKYEFMATSRTFLPLFAALILVSIVNRLLSSLGLNVPSTIGTVISVILMVGIAVVTLLITLQRFRNNLLSNEGYLMMTLPVSTDGLILSKLFVSIVWYVASAVVVILSILILAVAQFDLKAVVSFIKQVGDLIARTPLRFFIYAVEIVVGLVLGIFSGILLLYASLALSMLVDRRRGLFAFGAYVVITTAVQTLVAILIAIAAVTRLMDRIDAWFVDIGSFGQSQIVILVVIVGEAALCAALYYITRVMLKSKLNLQ